MYKLSVKTHFDAAHYIRDYAGKCSRQHGHRWDVEVVLVGDTLDRRNILVDFAEVKRSLNDILGVHLDHYQLNDVLGEPNVTAEFLAEWLFRHVTSHIRDIKLECVRVWESPDCCAEYKA